MNLSAPFIRRPVMTTLLGLSLLFFGIGAFFSMPVADLPNVDYPTVTVSASQPGGSPEYMASTIASPLESNFSTISDLSTISSISSQGSTQIVLNFKLGVDLNSKLVEVQSAITESLPDLPPMPTLPSYQKTNPSQKPILYLTLSSPFLPLGKLYEYGYNFFSQPLSMITGISQVSVYGYPYALRVQADPMKLYSYKLDFNELASLINAANPNLPSGVLQGDRKHILIQTNGQLTRSQETNKVILKDIEGTPLRIQDIGRAIDGVEQRDPYFRYLYSGTEENMVVLGVSRLPGSNTLAISKAIRELLPDLIKNIPGSAHLNIFYDRGESILAGIREVEETLLVAFLLVVLVIFLFFGKIRDSLIPSFVIPLALTGSFIAMYLAGFSIDNLSLLALILAIGFIIDDLVVVQENIARHVEEGKERMEAAFLGSKEISITVLTMTLALGSSFLPLLFMPGMLGKIFFEFSLTILFCILVSGMIALTVNPMICSRFLVVKKEETPSKKILRRIIDSYAKLLEKSFSYKKIILAIGAFFLFLSILLLHLLSFDFLPPSNSDVIEGLTQCAEGTSRRQVIEHEKKVEGVLLQSPYIESIGSIAGYPTADQGGFFIRLKDPKKRPSASVIVNELNQKLSSLTGINCYLMPIPLLNLQIGTGATLGDYQYLLKSANEKELYEKADLLIQKMKEMPELKGINSDLRRKSPTLKVEIDRDKAGNYGVTADEIEKILQFAYSGGRISTFNMGINLYDLILEASPEYNLTSKDLNLLYIKSKTKGSLIPLSMVASWKEVASFAWINHTNIFPSVTISFSLADKVALGEALNKIEKAAKEVLGDKIEGKISGGAEVFRDTFKALAWLFVLTLFVLYVILGILYESFIHPLTILSSLPLALFGGLFTLFLFHEPLSLSSAIGLFVLVGLVQKNGIILIDFALDYLKQPGESKEKAILEASKIRFRPIVMTTLAAMMGAVPLFLSRGEMASLTRPIGLVIFGGLLFSQWVTLFITPSLFLLLEDLRMRSKNRPQA